MRRSWFGFNRQKPWCWCLLGCWVPGALPHPAVGTWSGGSRSSEHPMGSPWSPSVVLGPPHGVPLPTNGLSPAWGPGIGAKGVWLPQPPPTDPSTPLWAPQSLGGPIDTVAAAMRWQPHSWRSPLPTALSYLLAFTVLSGLLLALICVAALALLAVRMWPR